MADLLSVVVPVYNEAKGVEAFHQHLLLALQQTDMDYEIIYVDDGSQDQTGKLIQDIAHQDKKLRLITLSRNFGKEGALVAGIAAAQGQAILTIDGDGEHPVGLIPKFVEAWRQGAQVVVGVRSDVYTSLIKRWPSKVFYHLFNRLSAQPLVPGSTDFRLIDSEVRQALLSLHETDRITRGLIDWLGFERKLIYFKTNHRLAGTASYSRNQLFGLAANSFVSLTPKPLYLFGYLGVFITVGAFLLGLSVLIEQILANDPLHWRFTGTAMLAILILFLVGVLLMAQGMLSLYVSHIHSQSKKRPLYVVNKARSYRLPDDEVAQNK